MSTIKVRERALLACLFESYPPIVLALCMGILSDPTLAQEVLDDVFWELRDTTAVRNVRELRRSPRPDASLPGRCIRPR